MTHRRPVALLACSLAFAAAACGGASKTGAVGAAGTAGHGAEAFPDSTLVFIDANADLNSSAWKKVREVAGRFPGFAKVEAKLQEALNTTGKDGTVFARDIQPWLGDEAAFGVLSVTIAGGKPKPEFVGFVAVTDDAKALAALTGKGGMTRTGDYKGYTELKGAKGDGEIVTAAGKGALLIANDTVSLHASIDAREGGAQLASADLYKEALSKLPADNVLVGYADGGRIAQLAQAAVGLLGAGAADAAGANLAPAVSKAQLDQVMEQLGALRAVSFSLGGEDAGFRGRVVELVDAAKVGVISGLGSGKVTLLDSAPAGSVLFAAAPSTGDSLRKLLDQYAGMPDVEKGLKGAEAMLGVSLDKDIVPLFDGELGIYVGGGAPISGALLLKPKEAANASKTIRKITAAVSAFQPGFDFSPLAGGADGQRMQVGANTVAWLHDGDLISIGVNNGATKPAGGLSGSEAFKRAAGAAGMPGDVSGLFYADVTGIVGLAERQDGQSIPAEAAANLAPLGGVLGWAKVDGGTISADLFVEVRAPAA